MKFERVLREGIEYRLDPLTGEQTRINPARAKRVKQAQGNGDWKKIIENRERNVCFARSR